MDEETQKELVETVLKSLRLAIADLRALKTGAHTSEEARYCAVAITDTEKILAYVEVHVAPYAERKMVSGGTPQ
jgi:hypothetical protein